MSGLNKRAIGFSADRGVAIWFDHVSKAFLADLVIDFARRNAGDEDLDGLALLHKVVEEAEPVAVARGDKLPRPDAWEHAVLRRYAREGSNTSTEHWRDLVIEARPEMVGAFRAMKKAAAVTRTPTADLFRVLDACPPGQCLSIRNVSGLLGSPGEPVDAEVAHAAILRLVSFGRFEQVGEHAPDVYRRVL